MRDRRLGLAAVGGWALALALGALTIDVALLRVGPTAWAMLAAAWGLVASLVGAGGHGKRRWAWVLASLVLLAVVVSTRLALVRGDGGSMRLVTLPGSVDARYVDRLVDERDIVLFGAQCLAASHWLPDNDASVAVGALREACDRFARAEGAAPSPAPATYLGLQDASHFDTMVFSPTGPDAHVGIVFLHGLGGSFGLEAWQFAVGPRRAGATVVCPAIGPTGDWWSPRGEAVLRETLAWMRARGFRRPILAGLSNGAAGACLLAPRLREQIGGIVLVSGAAGEAMPPRGMPVLALQGRLDGMVSADAASEYVRRAGASGRLVEWDAGHLLLVVEHEQVESVLENWVRAFARSHERG